MIARRGACRERPPRRSESEERRGGHSLQRPNVTNVPRYPTLSDEPVEFIVEEDEAGQRLDALLTVHFHNYSRVHLRRVISWGGVMIDGRGGKPAYRVRAGQRVRIVLPEI